MSRLGLLRDHDFRGLFLSTTVSQFGQQVTMLALPLVAVIALDVSEFEVGVLAAMTSLAFLLIGLPAGAWVDRMRRRNVLIGCDIARSIILLTVPIAWWAGVLTIWQLYVVALAGGVFTVFFDVAYQSYLPHLVGRARLVEGNAKLETVRSTAHLSGPALAGQLIGWLGAPIALLLDAVTMGASALFVVRIRRREPEPETVPGSKITGEIREGLSFVLRNPHLRAIVCSTAMFNFWSAGSMAMQVVYLERELGLTPGQIGLLLSGFGVGGLLGSFVARRAASWIGEGRVLWVSTAVTAPGLLLLPAASADWTLFLAAAGMVLVGAGSVVYNITQVSFRQMVTPDRMLGRMNATIRFLVWGVLPLGSLVGGVLGQAYGSQMALWITATGGCLTFVPVLLSPLRNMRELPRPAEEAEPVKV